MLKAPDNLISPDPTLTIEAPYHLALKVLGLGFRVSSSLQLRLMVISYKGTLPIYLPKYPVIKEYTLNH